MRKYQKDIKPMYGIIKEMYEKGEEVKNIVEALQISEWAIYKAISIMGIQSRSQQRKMKKEIGLKYADYSAPVLEKVVIYGRWKEKDGVKYRTKKTFTDVAPLFIPR